MKTTLFSKSTIISLFVVILAGCPKESPPEPLTLQSATVTTPPTKTVYIQGEALDLTGLVITGSYNDGSTKQEFVTLTNVSGYNTNVTGDQILTVTVDGKSAIFTVRVDALALVSIAVTAPPIKTVYVQGEDLDLNGLVVTGSYNNGSTQVETVSAAEVSGYDAETEGVHTLTVTIHEKTATFTVRVNAAVLDAIAVSTPPIKTVYFTGEPLDLSGLVVTGSYNDGSTQVETVSDLQVLGYDADIEGPQTLTVRINDKSATFTVTVHAPVLLSIAVSTLPTKTVYVTGEALDLSGLVVIGSYNDGSTQVETPSVAEVSGYDADTEGSQTLTITINETTATFTVKVHTVALTAIAVTAPPTKTIYITGETLDLSGLVITGSYNDGSTQTETLSIAQVSGYHAETEGLQTLTVKINDKPATFTVRVHTAALASIAVTTLPTKTIYVTGEPLDIRGLVVTGSYQDGSTQMETLIRAQICG
ncbi:MAG: bacterial Ig-like domain-containing protein [Treponema sp.]|jgi:uncharacterized protein YkuJ|nr:bacterial Ig-like domain-containing protein [Treponema sp.]